ncbi:Peptidoglycan-binding domain 1 protein [Kribbella flavida DSM 17836]|uniref:Peptidoglycan-binding domain 1 protein n=1 Tax=Kribbella flavida (strain DSM 17836 / JCM 10339 / NBRC 14399) TaxID=479435 RepID=D2PVK2_KRIFD|nr:efflux RND transporter periplasmic adaptor subunit [Kribbella flavida]ADB35242.1 Peptidoglycan-binding domain 1 protein [Kribbella flavida DSM 17836]
MALLAAGGVLTALLLTRTDNSEATDQSGPAALVNTAKVTQQTLKDTEDADGELGYGTTSKASSRSPGTVTGLPESGQQFHRGQTLYSIDNKPTTLMYGALPAYRRLTSGSEGPDVLQLEQNLQALGYDGFTADDEYTLYTAEAVEQWQEDRGLAETGSVELGQVLFAAGAVRVESVQAQEGAQIGPGQPVLSYSGTKKAVTVKLEAADLRLAKKGAAVDVTLPDDSTVKGRVEKVSTQAVPASGQEEATTELEVIVAIDNQKALASYPTASVDVSFTASERKNVLTVPVAALLALSEGGFGVEVSDDTGTKYVPVKTGLFAGGRVEISGPGIKAGLAVGVPK